MVERKRARLFEHPVVFGSHISWLKLLWQTRDIDRRFLPRALVITLATLATTPLRAYESARYGRVVKRTAIHPSPVFIVGHWRTGTTHLHNLLCRDTNNGHVSTFQAFAPGLCLVGEKVIKRRIPARDGDAILREMGRVKELLGLEPDTLVRSCYEAGRDGFWLHRFLEAHGIENLVIDSSSIEVNRRKR